MTVDLSKIPESVVEKKVGDFAKARGWIVSKFKSENDRSAPDRIFLRRGVAVFIEFKRFGKVATKAQAKRLKTLTDEGFTAIVIDNVEAGKNFFRTLDL